MPTPPQPESEHIRHIPFEWAGRELEYRVTDALEAACHHMLSQTALRKYTVDAYKQHQLSLRRGTEDYRSVKASEKSQNRFFDTFCALNEHLKTPPGAMMCAYQHFTGQFRTTEGPTL